MLDRHPPSLKDIAAIAEVSTTTVHRALHGTGRISPETRERILTAARDLGYRPNDLARGLRQRRTMTMGVVFGSLGVSFFSELLTAVESTARAEGYALLVACSQTSPDKERDLVELLLGKSVDGLLVAPTHPACNRDYYTAILEEGVALAFVDCFMPGLDVDLVATDNERGGYLAGRHLLAAGRKQPAMLSFPRDGRHLTSVSGRLAGCARAAQEAGLEAPREIGADLAGTVPSEEYGYVSVREALAAGVAFDGLFVVHDAMAYGALAALREAGRRVPEEVAVVGFDDLHPSAYVTPALTSVRQPVEAMGAAAVQLLRGRMEQGYEELPARQRLLAPTLVQRASCGE